MKQTLSWCLPVVLLQLFGMGAFGQTIPPRVELLSPPHGASIPGPADILIAAHASDPDGLVVSVEFFVNGESLGLGHGISTPLFSFFYLLWENAGAGEYGIVAVATDNSGLTTESDPVAITVFESPEPVVVGVAATDPEAAEPGPLTDVLDTATFTFRRSGSTDNPLDVYFSLHGEAIAGEDYAEVPTVITIPAGRSWAHLLIEPLDDDLVEGDEGVVVRIEPVDCEDVASCYEVSRYNRARAVIHDNDRPPNLPPRVRLLHPENGQVFLAQTDIALVAGAFDLDGQVVQVEFFEGDNSLGVVPTPEVAGAGLPDANDIATHPLYRLWWEDVPAGHHVLTAVATDDDGDEGRSQPVEIRVVEIQPPPVVTLTATDEEGTEPDDATIAPDVAVFTVHRTGNLQRPLTVHYRIGGSAENGVDYARIAYRVHLPVGARTADIVIRPLDDNLPEGDESVHLRLVPCATIADVPAPIDSCYRVGDPSQARAVIHDNDPPPPNHPPRVKLVHPVEGTVFRAPADIRLVAAAHDVDGWVRAVEFFANGVSVGLVPSNMEPIELFHLLWEQVGPGPYELVAVAIDDDGETGTSGPVHIRVIQVPEIPAVNIFAVDPIAFEGPSTGTTDPDTATFAVVRSGPTDDALHVRYVVAGTATPGEDYVELSGEVTIETGQSAARVIIVPIDDDLPEPLETVDVRVVQRPCVNDVAAPYGCYRVGQHPGDRAHIVDDDPFPNIPPRVEIVRPVDGAEIPGPTDIRIVAKAADVDGMVRSVEFFADGQSIGIVTAPPPGSLAPVAVGDTAVAPELQYPWQILWRDVQPGTYRLTAIATDNDGAQTESLVVHIRVFAQPDPPVVEVKATDPKATEPNPLALSPVFDRAVFTICRSGSLDQPLRVHYWLRGEAENGIDYRPIPTSVVIPQGEECAEVWIDPIDDNLVEGQESVVLALRDVPCDGSEPTLGTHSPNCYMVGRQNVARAIICDNDLPPNEPPRVRLVHPENGDVFHAPADIRLAAWAFDVDGHVRQVEFFEGENSLGVVMLPTPQPNTDATHPDILPLFQLLWQDVPAGRYLLTAVATDDDGDSSISEPVKIKVVEIQPPPVVTIVATDPEAAEPNPPGPGLGPVVVNTATFTVSRHGPVDRPLRVHYGIDGSAENGVDYARIPDVVTIPEGASSADIRIVPLDDDIYEGTERVHLRVRPSICVATFPPPADCHYIIGTPSMATAAILDNDPPPTNEPPVVELVRPLDGSIFLAPADILLVAAAGDPDGEVVSVEFFASGQSLGTASPPDLSGIGNLYRLLWEQAGPGQYELTAVATDDDGDSTTSEVVHIAVIAVPPTIVNVFATDPEASERVAATPPNVARLTVVRNGPVGDALTVFYRVDGTAENGEDYELLSGEILIPQGRLAADIVVKPIDDLLVEGTESVRIEILVPPCLPIEPPPPHCYVTGPFPVAEAIILDNDPAQNVPPVAQIAAPQQGATFTAPATIPIQVAALDPDGWVQTVEIFANGQLIDEQSIFFIVAPPPGQQQFFDFTWENVPAGLYLLRARATDQLGAPSWSGPVVVWVRESPVVPVVNVWAIDRLAREEPGPNGQINQAVLKVRRSSQDISRPLDVHYEIGGSATNGEDYETLSGVVTIPAGRHCARFEVVPIDDELPEGRETVKVGLFVATDEDPPPYIVGRHGRAGAVIVDRDFDPPPLCTQLPGSLLYICQVAAAGDAFQVEVTENMVDWEPVETITVVEDAMHYTDVLTDGPGVKCYRFIPIPHDPMMADD